MIDCENCIHVQMCKWCDEMVKTHTCDYYETCDSFEPKRPHGEWIEKPWGVVCSRCKAQALHTPNGNQSRSDYCPDCGADMRRKEGDEK